MLKWDTQLKNEVLRKVLHVLLSVVLLLPFNQYFTELLQNSWGITPREYYAALTVTAAFVNATQIRRPLIREELLKVMRSARRKAMDEIKNLFLSKVSSKVTFISLVDKLDEALTKLETTFSNQIRMLERSYERVSGYIGVTLGMVSVFSSFILFGNYAFYGVLALMVVDPTTALITRLLGRKLLPMSRTSVEGVVASTILFSLILLALGIDIIKSLSISIVAALVEAYGIEDNLSIPLAVSFFVALLGV